MHGILTFNTNQIHVWTYSFQNKASQNTAFPWLEEYTSTKINDVCVFFKHSSCRLSCKLQFELTTMLFIVWTQSLLVYLLVALQCKTFYFVSLVNSSIFSCTPSSAFHVNHDSSIYRSALRLLNSICRFYEKIFTFAKTPRNIKVILHLLF